jgi:cytochrome P450
MLEPLLENGGGDIAVAVELTWPLSAHVLCMFLNLPDEDWPQSKIWTRDRQQGAREDNGELAEGAAAALTGYIEDQLQDRRSCRPYAVEEDLMTGLLAAEDDARLTHDEVIGCCILLLKRWTRDNDRGA